MEKIRVGWSMATRWSDPPIVIMAFTYGTLFATLGSAAGVGYKFWDCEQVYYYMAGAAAGYLALTAFVWNFIYMRTGHADNARYIRWNTTSLSARWGQSRIPIADLCDHFLNGDCDFKGDVLETLEEHRNEFVSYRLTWGNLRFLVLQLFPNNENSSFKNKKATKKEIAEHYDRGNDFFAAFLGPRMVYTSAFYKGLEQSLEVAQDNKMSLICDKLHLKEGETFLDIGCGWGTLVRHAAIKYGAIATGVTLSVEGAAWCNEQNELEGCADTANILNVDYREIGDRKFDKIASIEMAEHVGLKNFQLYLSTVKDLMEDEGLFLMQVAGLRQGSNWEDLAWGLFMSRYIFPGADASTPLNWYIRQLEVAGYEVHSVETIGRHYSWTLRAWYHNFISNRAAMEKKYGDRLCRLWEFFLAWSTIASGQGSATCYQILSHKNTYDYPRDRWAEPDDITAGVGVSGGQFNGVGNGEAKKASRGRSPAAKKTKTPKASSTRRRRGATPSR